MVTQGIQALKIPRRIAAQPAITPAHGVMATSPVVSGCYKDNGVPHIIPCTQPRMAARL